MVLPEPSHRRIRIDAKRQFRVTAGDGIVEKVDLLVDVGGREGDGVCENSGNGGGCSTIHREQSAVSFVKKANEKMKV
jgi:hypothetical protein